MAMADLSALFRRVEKTVELARPVTAGDEGVETARQRLDKWISRLRTSLIRGGRPNRADIESAITWLAILYDHADDAAITVDGSPTRCVSHFEAPFDGPATGSIERRVQDFKDRMEATRRAIEAYPADTAESESVRTCPPHEWGRWSGLQDIQTKVVRWNRRCGICGAHESSSSPVG